MSDDRIRPAWARTSAYRPVHLALAATAVAGALAGGGLSLVSTPSANTESSTVLSSIPTKQSPKPVVASGFGTPDALSNGS